MSRAISSQSINGRVAADVLRIELLGGFRLSYGNQSVDDSGWRLAKARSLIKLLALTPGHSMHSEQLLEHLWPNLDPEAAKNNLHQALHVARGTLISIIPDVSGPQILRLRRQVLSLEPPGATWVDVETFEELISMAEEAADTGYYYRAIELYQGELLPEDRYEDWADEPRVILSDQYLAALIGLATLHEEGGEIAPAVDILRRIVAIDPTHEQASASLIRLYALTGRRQQAMRQYQRLAQALAQEFEIEPDEGTTALYQAIVDGSFPPEQLEPVARQTTAATALPAGEPRAAVFERTSDFVGRDAEILRLIQNLDRTVAGQGQVVTIAGEPGIGKTRLVEEFVRYARARNVAVYWGSSYDGEGAPAYWPWAQIIRDFITGRSRDELEALMGAGAADIRRIVPELRAILPDLEEPPGLDPDSERFRLFDSATTFLANAAARAPLVLLLEDLHWADRSTLLLLEFLTRELANIQLLIIATYRHVEVGRAHPLTRTLGELTRHGMDQRFNITGLSVEEIARYVNAVTDQQQPTGLASAIHHQSEGNPLFVREIVRLLVEEGRLDNPDDVRSWRLTIPPGIRETIALRTDRLSENAHRILSTASVSGRDFELPVVSRVAGIGELDALDALEEAAQIGLIEESRSRANAFRFSHAITRQTVYDDLSQARRLRLHLRTGEVIAAATDRALTELAHHFFIAAPLGVGARAIDYLEQAGEQAIHQVAYGEAAQYFEQALALIERATPVDQDRQFQLLLLLGDARRRAGNPGQALAVYQRAAELARTTKDPDQFAEAALGVANAAYLYGEVEGAHIPLLEEALANIEASGNLVRLRLVENLVHELSRAFVQIADAPDRARALSDEVSELARSSDDPQIELVARAMRQQVMWDALDHRDRIENSSHILSLAEQLDDQQRLLSGYAWRIFEFIANGDMDCAAQDDRAYFQIAAKLRQPNNLWAATFRQATYALLHGRFEEAESFTEQALQLGRRHTPDQAEEVYFTQLSVIRREQGRSGALLELAREVAARHPAPSLYSILYRLIQTEAGLLEEPVADLDDLAAGGFDTVPRNLLWLPNIALLSLLSACLHHEAAAARLLELLQPYEGRNVSGGGNVVVWGSACYYLGLLTLTTGDLTRAEGYLSAGIEMNRRMGARPFEAYGHYVLGRTLHRRNLPGDCQAASDQIQQARSIATTLGMDRLQHAITAFQSNREGAGKSINVY